MPSPYRAVNTFNLGYKNQSVYAVSGTSRCLFSDKYKTHKYSLGRTYSCWMLNCWRITWPVGFERLMLASHQNKWRGILASRFYGSTQVTMRATCSCHPILRDVMAVQHYSVNSTYREAPHYGTLTNPPSLTLCQRTCSSQREFPNAAVPNAPPISVSLFTWNPSIGHLHRRLPRPVEYAETGFSKQSTFINL